MNHTNIHVLEYKNNNQKKKKKQQTKKKQNFLKNKKKPYFLAKISLPRVCSKEQIKNA